MDTTRRPATFTEDKLKDYSAVIFLDTPGELLNVHQQTDFERYIQAGGGYVGVTPAIYVKYNWPWYERLIGQMPGTKVPNPEYQETPAQLTAAKEDGAEATNEEGETLPLKGSFIADKADDEGTYVFEVRYAGKDAEASVDWI